MCFCVFTGPVCVPPSRIANRTFILCFKCKWIVISIFSSLTIRMIFAHWHNQKLGTWWKEVCCHFGVIIMEKRPWLWQGKPMLGRCCYSCCCCGCWLLLLFVLLSHDKPVQPLPHKPNWTDFAMGQTDKSTKRLLGCSVCPASHSVYDAALPPPPLLMFWSIELRIWHRHWRETFCLKWSLREKVNKRLVE